MSKTSQLLEDLIPSANLFLVVGVGASAGGLDAFKELIRNIPDNSGMAYIFVQHLSPKFESILTHILQNIAKIPVIEIIDDIFVKPDHIYIIPSNKLLVANDGKLDLHARDDYERQNVIDLFFSSLAEIHQEYAIGVVLSGTGSDGTIGLKNIKDAGGITFAQNEESAAYFAMPGSAIEAGVADYQMRPELIPAHILKLTSEFRKQSQILAPTQKEEQTKLIRYILAIINTNRGIDFTYYKQTTIYRRILRRLGISNIANLNLYAEMLDQNLHEQEALFNDLLIPVTSFFRDPLVFNTVAGKLHSAITRHQSDAGGTRIWVTACSTGEEAYSLAMLLVEGLNDNPVPGNIQIFATDISEKVIRKARLGIYSLKDLAGVSDERRRRFFTRIDGQYQVNKQIREMCIFAVQNFLTDPPFARLDMICCRNVLIYMEPYLQQKALSTFHYSLRDGGLLWLGNSETVGSSLQFEPVLKSEKLYQRKPGSGKLVPTTSRHQESVIKLHNQQQSKSAQPDIDSSANLALLGFYGDVGVIVNDSLDVVRFRGSTARFLQPPEGRASLNIIGMAKEGLGFELRSLILLAKAEKQIRSKYGIVVDKGNLLVDVDVIPLQNTIDPYYFVRFRQSENSVLEHDMQRTSTGSQEQENLITQYRSRVEQLEGELTQTREDMKAITQAQEAANEDLQSTNEELLSGSEELQSLNEELETTKEEVQSTNEELQLLNQELHERNDQLIKARLYAEAILATVHEPLVSLTRDFTIWSANAAFCRFVNIPADELTGRSFFKIQNKIWHSDILEHAFNKVFREGASVEDLEIHVKSSADQSRVFLVSAHKVLQEDQQKSLILLAMLDVTDTKLKTQQLIKDADSAVRQMNMLTDFFQDSPALLAILWGESLSLEFANTDCRIVFPEFSIKGEKLSSLSSRSGFGVLKKNLFEVMNTGKSSVFAEQEINLKKAYKGHSRIFVDLRIQPVYNDEGIIHGVFVFAVNITDKVRGRQVIESQRNRFRDMIMRSPAFAVTVTGPHHRIDIMNQTFSSLFGVNPPSGATVSDVLPDLSAAGFVEKLDLVFSTGNIIHDNLYNIRRSDNNGSDNSLYVNISIQPLFDENSVVTGLLILGYDITGQVNSDKQNQANLKRTIESIHQVGWTANPDGTFEIMNQKFLEYTGVEETEALQRGWASFIHPSHISVVQQTWEHAVGHAVFFQGEWMVKTISGDYKWHIAKASPVLKQSGEVFVWVVTLTEIHDQKLFTQHLEAQVRDRTRDLEESNEMLRHSNDSLQQFAVIASHDLQEPLRKIMTFTAILNRRFSKNISEEGREVIQKIKYSSDRMSQLVKEVLEYSKVLKGRHDFKKTNLQNIFEDVLKDLELLISENDAEINQQQQLPVLFANPLQMNQLFYNLLTNSVKFRQETVPPEITIKVRELSGEMIPYTELSRSETYLEIIIADNGIGFEQQYSDQVFDVFERLHSAEEFEGTGIGLALCKQIMLNHNGLIRADSEPGSGATFTLLFPLSILSDH